MRSTLRGLLLSAALLCTAQADVGVTQADQAVPTLISAAAGTPAMGRPAQVAQWGYTEEEFSLRGQAQVYAEVGEWGPNGLWTIKPRGTPQAYETRVLVRRPKDPAHFNGIVVVEWLNTSLGFEIDGGWVIDREELTREGYAWVGVSAERGSTQALRQMNATRYAQTNIADDELSFDVFTQAAQAIRQAANQWGKGSTDTSKPVRLLGMGYSRSASFVFTYMNAFQLRHHTFDGYLVRGAAAMAPRVHGSTFNAVVIEPQIRTDLDVPLMQVQTQMEVGISRALSKTLDTDKVRYWEVAGATHFDQFMNDDTLAADHGALKLDAPHCIRPLNTLPARMIDHAALHALRNWVSTGMPPPKAPRLARTNWGFVQDDELGHAEGGVRLPEMDAPLMRYGMFGFMHSNFPTWPWSVWAGFACMASGTAVPLDAEVLRARYPQGKASYLQAYRQAADKLLKNGFLRPADHALLLQQAAQQVLPQ